MNILCVALSLSDFGGIFFKIRRFLTAFGTTHFILKVVRVRGGAAAPHPYPLLKSFVIPNAAQRNEESHIHNLSSLTVIKLSELVISRNNIWNDEAIPSEIE